MLTKKTDQFLCYLQQHLQQSLILVYSAQALQLVALATLHHRH